MPADENLLVLIGAGASHDAKVPRPNPGDHCTVAGLHGRTYELARPPLTEQLVRDGEPLNTILGRYREALPLVDELRRRVREARAKADTGEELARFNLEDALREYQDSASDDPTRVVHMTAFRLVLRDLFWECSDRMTSTSINGGATSYTSLVRELHRWASARSAHVCLTSFNYDIILEQALADQGWGFDRTRMEMRVEYAPMSYLKPHGSVDWEWVVEDLEARDRAERDRAVIENPQLFESAGTRQIRTVRFARHDPRDNQPDPVQPGVPALALPVTEKTDVVWPREQEEHFERVVGASGRVLVAGWRAADEHFVQRLRELPKPRTLFVCKDGKDGGEVQKRLRSVPIGDSRVFTDGFSALVESSELDWLLES